MGISDLRIRELSVISSQLIGIKCVTLAPVSSPSAEGFCVVIK